MQILATENLTKKYKDKYAVKNVNMHIEKGDIYGFVGENGAGKTTIIRLISGLASPTQGEYFINNISYKDKKIYEEREKMAAIVESVTLNKNLTALDNLRYQNILLGKNKTDEELIELINIVGLNYEAEKNRKVKNYSLGMRQRVGLALIMVGDPEFIILDEPMNGLDPQGFVDVRETIVRLNKKGVTFLISSHILSELDKICNKIGIISHGKLVEETTIDELHEKEKQKLVIVTNDNERFIEIVKKELKIEKLQVQDNVVTIYDEVEINDLLALCVKKKISIVNFNTIQETIEDYYIKVTSGRGKDE